MRTAAIFLLVAPSQTGYGICCDCGWVQVLGSQIGGSRSIWRERNARIFQHCCRTTENLMADIKEELYMWKSAGMFKYIN
uniref:Secreted protein n=1 Tax=Leersia perrieri TaxID=77586 RepID=A0A0D9WLQ7_9ORYZ